MNQLAPADRRAAYTAVSSVASDLLGPAIGTALYAPSTSLPWIAGMPAAALAALGLGAALAR